MWDWVWDWYVVGGQMVYQVEVEWQLLCCQFFEDCEDVFVVCCCQEEIVVFDIGWNVVECKYVVQFVVVYLLCEIGVGNSGENGYVGCVRLGCWYVGGVYCDSR